MLHEVQVVRQQHDIVSRRHAAHRDEADEGGDADVVELPPGEGERTGQRQRDAEHDLEREAEAAEVGMEENNDHHHDHRAEDGDAPGGVALGLELAFVGHEIALR